MRGCSEDAHVRGQKIDVAEAESGICVQYVGIQQMRIWEGKVSGAIAQGEKRPGRKGKIV